MSDAKQPDCLCRICKFDHNGNCLASPKTDWCVKKLLHAKSPAPSAPTDAATGGERVKRLEEIVEAAYREGLWDGVGEMNESYNGHCNPDEKAMWERSVARAALAAPTPTPAPCPLNNDECRGSKCYRFDECEVKA